jgi:hypothetical protein
MPSTKVIFGCVSVFASSDEAEKMDMARIRGSNLRQGITGSFPVAHSLL